MLEKLQKTLAQEKLIPQGGGVLVALSGGPDSMALLCGLMRLRQTMGFSLCAAHFNHGIRPAAQEDEQFCRTWCEKEKIPFFAGRADVPALAKKEGRTLEEAAREARYAFLRQAAEAAGACRIAVAHHRDDQAETVLFRLGRGSGLKGLSGMALQNGAVIRPLLFVSREEILAFLKEEAIPFCRDETNSQPCCARNRLRALLPELEKVHPGFSENVCRAAKLLLRDEEALEAWAARELAARLGPAGLCCEGFGELPQAVSSRVLRQYCAKAGLCAGLEERHVDALWRLAGRPCGRISLPGNRQAVVGNGVLSLQSALDERADPKEFCVPLAADGVLCVPDGVLELPDGRLCVRAASRPERLDALWPMGCYVRPEALEGAVVRPRRPGDRIHPIGAPGGKKLKDFYIDRKIPKERRRWPVIARGSEVLFAPGAGFSAMAELKEEDGAAVELRYLPGRQQDCSLAKAGRTGPEAIWTHKTEEKTNGGN